MTTNPNTPPIYRGLAIGIVGVLAVAIAPILLTRLYETGRISAEGIGIAICIEFIAMAFGSMLGAKILSQGKLAARLTLVCIFMAAANAWTPLAGGNMILVSRALAGLFGGMMIWVVLTTIIRSRTPERWSGIYLSGHTAVQFATATVIAVLIVPQFGASGGYWVLAAISLALIPVALAMPDIRPINENATAADTTSIPMVGWMLLGSILLLNAMFSSVISYAEVEFQARGFSIDETLAIVPVILLAQMIGGICAAIFAARSPQAFMVMAVCAALAVAIWWLTTPLAITQVYMGFAVFGFCWLFVGPFQLGLLLRKSAAPQTGELLAAAQLLGLAIGPLAAAGLLLEGGYPPAGYHFALIAASVVILALALMMRGSPAPVASQA